MADKNQPVVTPTPHVNEITRLSIGAEIKKGILISPNDIRIDGKFDGKIQTKGKVVLGEQATIKGDVFCTNADIWGKMEGNIIVSDVLTLMNTCEYTGVLQATKLSIEKGAKFNGTCKIINQDEYAKISGEFEGNKDVKATFEKVEELKKI
ncbi:MAG: polymer-forming cytoskeletal protein [Bacteroidales bacterium]|jgi:cytoskeletal protein CcmA (bactofilin family)